MDKPIKWKATKELRWDKRVGFSEHTVYSTNLRHFTHVLQQKWVAKDGSEEWRDIPTYAEVVL